MPPPSAPVLFGDVVHVVESYGYRGVLGTIEWFPSKKTWIGLGLDAGIGDYPVGPVFAGLSPNGIMHAAWTESLLSFDLEAAPVTLVERQPLRELGVRARPGADERAGATGDRARGRGEPVDQRRTTSGSIGDSNLWAGTIVRGRSKVELDGWISGYAVAPRGGRDLLLGGPDGLRWFHVPRRVTTQVTIEAADDGDLGARSSGHVGGRRQRHGDDLPRAARRAAHADRPRDDQRAASTRSSTARRSGRSSTAPSTPTRRRACRTARCCASRSSIS